jgi:hypothetical protein
MNKHRSAVLALAACAASLTVAACTAGITTAPPATSAAARSHSASVARSSPSQASSGRMISVSGSVGNFPVPAGAKVAENIADGQESIVIFGSITPADVSSFYATALPRAGYAIAGNSLVSEGSGGAVAFIQFSGHGYKGNIDALAKFPNSGVSLAGLGTKNVTTITIMPK